MPLSWALVIASWLGPGEGVGVEEWCMDSELGGKFVERMPAVSC